MRSDYRMIFPIFEALSSFKEALVAVVVESTFSRNWLVDGLMESGFHIELSNLAATSQYEGLNYAGD